MSAQDAARPLAAEYDPARDKLRATRLAAGLLQGLVLYLLYLAADNHSWPSTNPYWMAPLVMVTIFVPLLFLQGVGTIRMRTLTIWCAVAALTLALLAWIQVWRQWEPVKAGFDSTMTFAFVFFTAAGLFIGQSLVAAGDNERRRVASYHAYFEAAWKLGVQFALAAAFVGVFWGVLWLGATLFELIRLSFVETLIEKSWFAIPATTLATAAAIHLTDVRSRLVAGIRAVALTLLSWLLPLMVVIGGGFVFSLPFTGLAPLFDTKSAAAILLTSAGVLVVLINAAFQDGDPSVRRPPTLRFAEFAAALILVPIVAIAAYALWLRVAQYGWTVERVESAATILVAACYAGGYAFAALASLRGGPWMVWIEATNIVTSVAIIGLLLLLFTPIADPARLAVNSQVARLQSGALDPHHFDFDYLKNEGGRYGRTALNTLVAGPSPVIARMAKDELNGTYTVIPMPSETIITRNITVYPNTRALPRNFARQDWRKLNVPACLTNPDARCDAYFANLDPDGGEDVVLVSGGEGSWTGTVFQKGRDNLWRPVGGIFGQCNGQLAAMRRGDVKTAPQVVWRNWVVGGISMIVLPTNVPSTPCPR